MSDYTPSVSQADVERLIDRDYPQHRKAVIMEILRRYGRGEAHRVHAAALKEGGGDPGKLERAIELANLDYRDLLMAAEYPNQARQGYSAAPTAEVIEADWTQYNEAACREVFGVGLGDLVADFLGEGPWEPAPVR